jgi:hypothetical protein
MCLQIALFKDELKNVESITALQLKQVAEKRRLAYDVVGRLATQYAHLLADK